jgi:hypothetical protein
VNSHILQVKLTANFKRMANKENGKWINRLKGKVSNYLDTVGEKKTFRNETVLQKKKIILILILIIMFLNRRFVIILKLVRIPPSIFLRVLIQTVAFRAKKLSVCTVVEN